MLRQHRKSILENNRTLLEAKLQLQCIELLKQLPVANKIGLYFATDEEISLNLSAYFDTSQLYYPILHPHLKRTMWFSNHPLRTQNRFGIVEPHFDYAHIIAPWELDIVFVPLVSFDRNLNRMGMGGGFYDYSFRFKQPHTLPIWIGVALDEQEMDSIIVNDWDIPLDYLITPTRILRHE